MKLYSIYNAMNRLERQRAQKRIQRLRDAARETLREATMDSTGLTPCPGCGGSRPYQQRLCERCLLADAEQHIGATVAYGEGPRPRPIRRPSPEHRPSDFARALVPELGDNPQGTGVMSLREQGAVAREHGDAAIRYGQRARLVMARSLEDDRQAHGIGPNLAVAISCLIGALVAGLLWWAQPDQERIAEQPATVPPTWSAW